ncbi:MAG: DUF4271 domain-containing protein [Crocinitomicaceae bacterium]|nr:DUF4271 domain-containing protein [Crocinitomicaceae bacterium]
MDHYWSTIIVKELIAKQNRDLHTVDIYFSNEVMIILIAPLIVFLFLMTMQTKHRVKLLLSDYFSYQKPTKFGFLQQYLQLPLSLFIWSIISAIIILYFLQQPSEISWSEESLVFATIPIVYFFWLLLATNAASFIAGVYYFRRPLIVISSQMFFIIVLILSIAVIFQMAYPASINAVHIGFVAVTALVLLQRIIKSIWVCLTNRISLYYLILYLCALEIAPLVFIYRKIAVFEGD